MLFKERTKGRQDGEKYLNRYSMSSREKEITGI